MIIKLKLKDKRALGVYKKLARNAERLRPALVEIGGMLEDASEEAFDREGPGWKPLKPATIRQRKREKALGKILQKSGGMANRTSAQVRGKSVFIGNNEDHGPVHQLGSRKKNIPARKYLLIGRTQIEKAVQILERHTVKGT